MQHATLLVKALPNSTHSTVLHSPYKCFTPHIARVPSFHPMQLSNKLPPSPVGFKLVTLTKELPIFYSFTEAIILKIKQSHSRCLMTFGSLTNLIFRLCPEQIEQTYAYYMMPNITHLMSPYINFIKPPNTSYGINA